jgi:hypothetical protein
LSNKVIMDNKHPIGQKKYSGALDIFKNNIGA